jgi:hypothetical protein
MSLQAAIAVIDRLVREGVIPRYAVAGAVGAAFYLEPASTFDLDVMVSVDAFRSRPGSPLITLEPIREALAKAGYAEFRDEGIVVEGWPVQFLPAESPLDVEALEQSVEVEVTGGSGLANVRVLRAEHLMAIAVSVGREKDYLRIAQFIGEGAYDRRYLAGVLDRHGLRPKWLAFCRQAGVRDPSVLDLAP